MLNYISLTHSYRLLRFYFVYFSLESYLFFLHICLFSFPKCIDSCSSISATLFCCWCKLWAFYFFPWFWLLSPDLLSWLRFNIPLTISFSFASCAHLSPQYFASILRLLSFALKQKLAPAESHGGLCIQSPEFEFPLLHL